jgi:hypothetical protein
MDPKPMLYDEEVEADVLEPELVEIKHDTIMRTCKY